MSSPGTHHEAHDRSDRVVGSSDRGFGLVFTAVFLLLGGWSLWKAEAPWWWSFGVAGVFAVLAMVAPGLLGPLNRLWTLFGALLHRITNPIILGLLFFLVFAPMGLALRLVGKKLLSETDPAASSYWICREPPGPDPSTMPQQF